MKRVHLPHTVCVLLALLQVFACACSGPQGEPISQAIEPSTPPEQDAPLDTAAFIIDVDGDRLSMTPRARYRIAARVLSTERYYFGWRAHVSPLDLALGWGAMADRSVDAWIDWSQNDRWYFWQWKAGSPYQNTQIRTQSANVHAVPASDVVRRALLRRVHVGSIVELTGQLIDIAGPDSERWNTSLSRTDTGDHSCELMWIERLSVDGAVYY